jgi:hypothetical protein
MSLPARQQWALRGMDRALQASEPHLAGMFATFTRLNRGEPLAAEALPRMRWPRPGTSVYAAVLIPVMFISIIIGSLVSGTARSATVCEVGFSAGGSGSGMLNRAPSCPKVPKATRMAARGETTTSTATSASGPCAARTPAGRAGRRPGIGRGLPGPHDRQDAATAADAAAPGASLAC